MDKLNKMVAGQPVIATVAIVAAALLGYHNGVLNFMFSKPSKAGQPKTE